MRNAKYVLCSGRHEDPATANLPSVFDSIPYRCLGDFDWMVRTARSRIGEDVRTLDLYVTGFTPALCAVIRVCIERGTALTLWHWDKRWQEYNPQRLLSSKECAI